MPPDPRDQATGVMNVDNIQTLLHSAALYPLTQLKGSVSAHRDAEPDEPKTYHCNSMSVEDFEELVQAARGEANDPSLKVCDQISGGILQPRLTNNLFPRPIFRCKGTFAGYHPTRRFGLTRHQIRVYWEETSSLELRGL
jgi:hypothetical protein